MSYLIANPKDRFSHDAAHILPFFAHDNLGHNKTCQKDVHTVKTEQPVCMRSLIILCRPHEVKFLLP